MSDVASVTGLSQEYINNLKKLEDTPGFGLDEFHTKAYQDKNGNWTIGVGHLIKPDEMAKYKDATLSKAQVCNLLAEDLQVRVKNLKAILGADTYEKMPIELRDAVMDFTFNRGETTIKNHPGFVDAIKKGDYAKAISLMNIDYSTVKNKDGTSKKVYLTGMVKRRLFEIHLASRIYKGKLPKSVKDAAQNLYNNGLKYMQTEFKDEKRRANIKAGYNEYVKELFGNDIVLK